MNKKFLALDYGAKFVGLAAFHQGVDPYPIKLGRIANKGLDNLFNELRKICAEELVTDIIIGVPYFTDGKESTNTKFIKDFIVELTKALGDNYSYHQQDETLTSHEAKDRMLNSPEFNFKVDLKQIDALSAQIILEDFLKK